jgi:apolipoprotein N-acyltransferase
MMDLSLLFDLGNVFVLPFWGLMILAPRWEVSRRVMASPLPFVALALLYLYGFLNSLSPESAADLANPTLESLTRVFSQPPVAFTGWIHFLVMDLLAGRWIYESSLNQGIWFRHSLLICLFAGPLGLLSHFVTLGLAHRFGKGLEQPLTDSASS